MPASLTRRSLALGTAAALAAPRLARADDASDTIKIGFMTALTGPGILAGKQQQNGIRMALDVINEKGVLGRKLEVVTEDDQTTNPGAVQAFGRLAARPDLVAFIGSIRSVQVLAVAPDLLKVAKPMMFGGSDPTLTQLKNPWMFRCRPNDTYSARVMAEFGVGTLQKRKWAAIYSTDSFGSNGLKALDAALVASGATLVLAQGYTNQTIDYTAVALAVRQSGADVMGSYCAFELDTAAIARQLRHLGVTIPWIGSSSIMSSIAQRVAGPALHGTYGVVDYHAEASPVAKAFSSRYEQLFEGLPDNQAAYTYDATNLLAYAITTAGGTDPDKLRQTLAGVHGFNGVEGEYNFDDKGDGLRGYNIAQNQDGKTVFYRRIDLKS